jgi:hypothetical protein
MDCSPFRLDRTRRAKGSVEMATWVKCTDKTGIYYVNFDRVEYVRRDLQGNGSCLFLSGHRDECMVVNEPPEELIRLPDSFRR